MGDTSSHGSSFPICYLLKDSVILMKYLLEDNTIHILNQKACLPGFKSELRSRSGQEPSFIYWSRRRTFYVGSYFLAFEHSCC